MTVLELKQKISQLYLEKKKRGFLDIDDLNEKTEKLILQKFQLVADSGIDGSDALRRMLEMKKSGIITAEHKEQYELLSMVRQARVQYFYDNKLVA
jgi:hypothetical protein